MACTNLRRQGNISRRRAASPRGTRLKSPFDGTEKKHLYNVSYDAAEAAVRSLVSCDGTLTRRGLQLTRTSYFHLFSTSEQALAGCRPFLALLPCTRAGCACLHQLGRLRPSRAVVTSSSGASASGCLKITRKNGLLDVPCPSGHSEGIGLAQALLPISSCGGDIDALSSKPLLRLLRPAEIALDTFCGSPRPAPPSSVIRC